jgi:hypothetical protein
VARIQPTSDALRQKYRQTLPGPKQHQAFDALARLIDDPRDDLAWHHAVGVRVAKLRPDQPHGTRWVPQLAEALGPSKELLAKSLRFTELYPGEEDIAALVKMGVNWTRLYFSFAVPDRTERHALLDEAVAKRWSDTDLRFAVQQRFHSKRRGVGGRPRRKLTGHGPEVALRELGRRCKDLAAYHAAVWAALKKAEWKRLVKGWPAAEREKLRDLLADTDAAAQKVAEVCEEVRRTLAELLKEIGH